jgi:hypothetical protein
LWHVDFVQEQLSWICCYHRTTLQVPCHPQIFIIYHTCVSTQYTPVFFACMFTSCLHTSHSTDILNLQHNSLNGSLHISLMMSLGKIFKHFGVICPYCLLIGGELPAAVALYKLTNLGTCCLIIGIVFFFYSSLQMGLAG